MGCVHSQETSDEERSRHIEGDIKKARTQMASEIKLLLLGSGESGKSTLVKQMKLIHEGGYSEEERVSYKEIIFANTVQSMRVILEQTGDNEDLEDDMANTIRRLWNEPRVRAMYARRNEYQLNDSAK
jgi:guanine nucleotide-binding protein subunit alpha